MPIYAFEGKKPNIANSTYVAPSAVIIGNVTLGERCYVGHHAVIRGDYGAIAIGSETAIEEGVIVHSRPDEQTIIGRRVTLGHGAMVHNATICDDAVIGMRAVVSDYAEVGEGSIVGELGLVRNGQRIPPEKVAVGAPARVIGDVGEQHQLMSHRAKDIYVDLAMRYARGGLVELARHTPLSNTTYTMVAIGTIHTPFDQATGTPIQGALSGDAEGEIVLNDAFQEGIEDLEGFSHLVVVYCFDRIKGFKLKTKPYLDQHERGIFATRSPSRPNPIGITVVRLIEINGRCLRIRGVDMLNNTPLLDIKPHIPAFDDPTPVRCGWFETHLERIKRTGAIPIADDRFHSNNK